MTCWEHRWNMPAIYYNERCSDFIKIFYSIRNAETVI
jgi:hypothetical protein